MSQLEFYYFPGTCARVTHIMLEECGLAFEPHVVVFPTGDHKKPPYLALNPSGKVPTVVIGGRPLTETLAILSWLDDLHPGVVFPDRGGDAFAEAKDRSLLAWFAATVHPVFTRFRMPPAIVDDPALYPAVSSAGARALGDFFQIAADQLGDRDWLLGSYSAADAYLFWLIGEASAGGLGLEGFPTLIRHHERVSERPAVGRVMAREGFAMNDLAVRGLLPPP